jgi:hypothetical protein
MVKQLVDHDEAKTSQHWSKYSELQTAEDRRDCLNSCHNLINLIYDGLDVEFETQDLGDTILLWQEHATSSLVQYCLVIIVRSILIAYFMPAKLLRKNSKFVIL